MDQSILVFNAFDFIIEVSLDPSYRMSGEYSLFFSKFEFPTFDMLHGYGQFLTPQNYPEENGNKIISKLHKVKHFLFL